MFIWMATSVHAQTDTLVSAGAVWKYLDDGSDQGTAWQARNFNDNSWSAGPAQLGYGDGDEATVVNRGTVLSHITTYFRHSFQWGSTETIGVNLRLLRDDGAIVYLNGNEIARSNMPTGAVDHQTLAASTISGSSENVWHSYPIAALPLDSGENVLAVEIHQRSNTSSDISFDLEMVKQIGAGIVRGPYLQMATSSSMMVKWRTNLAASSVVHYGTSPTNLNLQVADTAQVTDHALNLTGLLPNTRYYYALADDSTFLPNQDSGAAFITAPVDGTRQPIRIWALGDCGTGNSNARNVRDAYYNYVGNDHTDMILLLGDNAYDDGTDSEYQAAIFADMYEDQLRKSVVWSCPGNHDLRSASSGAQTGVYYDIFTFPRQAEAGGLASGTEAYYSFNYGNVHFIALDSEDSDRSTSGPMMTWLQNDLNAVTSDWVIVFFHHPPYTKGSHDSDNIFDSSGKMWEMRKDFLPVLEAAGVDLVLSGHSHSYERSYLLHGHYGFSWNLTSLQVLDNGDGRMNGDGAYDKRIAGPNNGKGAVYLTAGSSGKISGGFLNHPAHFTAINELGSVVVEVDGGQLDLKFIDDAGQVRDYFTMLKDSFLVAVQPISQAYGRLEAFPNPSGTDMVLRLPGERSGPFLLKIYNMAGQVIREVAMGKSRYTLNVRDLEAGVYLAEIYDVKRDEKFQARIVVR